MRIYLDGSVLVALFTADALTTRAETLLRDTSPTLVVSDFAAAEFASALARRVRMHTLTEGEARTGFATFDAWTSRVAGWAETTPADARLAAMFLRRLDLTLRTPDALNVAIAQRVEASLATFDEKMTASARVLGSRVVPS